MPEVSRVVKVLSCDEPNMIHWGPGLVVVLHNCQWVALVAPVVHIRRHLAPSVMHKNKCVRDKTREKKRDNTCRAYMNFIYYGYHAAMIFSVMAISRVRLVCVFAHNLNFANISVIYLASQAISESDLG